MKLRTIFTTMTIALALVASAQVQFTGNDHTLYEEVPATNTGLNKIYVLYNTDGVGMTYTAGTENPVTWYTYGELGGGYAEELAGVQHDGLTTSIAQVVPNKGYIIEEGTSRLYLWVCNYADYRLQLNGINVESDGDCGTVTLNVDGSGPDIVYYTITGVRKVMDRGITLSYNNLVWIEGSKKDVYNEDEDEYETIVTDPGWEEKLIEENEPSFKDVIAMPAPVENTSFTLTGDKFLKLWGEEQSVESNYYTTAAIEVHALAVQERRENDNERKTGGGDSDVLGGSAPAHITFTAYCSDAVMHKEWQMAREADFANIELRINQEEVDQVFEDAGITYWRFYGTNAEGTCEYYSDAFMVNIGESELWCPNVFTPGSSEGVNDVWKVSYRSIIRFHCAIFNKWGNQIIEFDDPSQGWDGTYRGKQVPAGVYYYVIQAEGSDGKRYKKAGDINIIRYKRIDRSGGGDGTIVEE